jgi:hypothetical protein
MRITIDIEETPGSKATVTPTQPEIMHISGGSVRKDLMARRNPDRTDNRGEREEGFSRLHPDSPPEVRHAKNPLRTGAAIERKLAERHGGFASAISAGPPAHLTRSSELHGGESGEATRGGKKKK